MTITRNVFERQGLGGNDEIPEFPFHVFEHKTPEQMLQELIDKDTLVGDPRVLNRRFWQPPDKPLHVGKASACFTRFDNRTPSLADSRCLTLYDRVDMMVADYIEASGYGSNPFCFAGELEIATALCFLADKKEHGWGLFPRRALLLVNPEELFSPSTVVVLTSGIENGNLRLYLEELPPDEAGLHHDDCRLLLTRTALEEEFYEPLESSTDED